MKSSCSFFFLLVLLIFTSNLEAQKRRVLPKSKSAQKANINANTNTAVVVDESLALLRKEPSLFADSIQRMRLGRIVTISGVKEADGVTFYRITALPKSYGWVQAEAVFGKFRRGDDERFARLIQASGDFDQIEKATIFLETYPVSPLRPAILLLLGDLTEEISLKLSNDATKKLSRREMAASGAPLHSFYLNFVSLDRYRKLGIEFLFNPSMKRFHYNGASWREIVEKFPGSAESAEAQKRLEALAEKMKMKAN